MPENSSDNVVFCFFSPQLISQFYRGCPMVFSRKLLFLKVSRGEGNVFHEGGGGSNG